MRVLGEKILNRGTTEAQRIINKYQATFISILSKSAKKNSAPQRFSGEEFLSNTHIF